MENTNNSVVCVHLLNGETLICNISNMDNNWITLNQPYLFAINPLNEKTIQFVPYLMEFTNDNLFDINVNNVVSIFKPHEKYAIKYIEIVKNGNKQTLLQE